MGNIPWRRAWQPTPVFLPGESRGQRGLVGYSLWGCRESDTTEQLTHTHTARGRSSSQRRCIRRGNESSVKRSEDGAWEVLDLEWGRGGRGAEEPSGEAEGGRGRGSRRARRGLRAGRGPRILLGAGWGVGGEGRCWEVRPSQQESPLHCLLVPPFLSP